MRWREARMVRLDPNSLIVQPIWIRGPLTVAWSKNVSHSLRCLNSRVTSKKAYKQVPVEPSLAGLAVMVQWHPQKRCPAFQVGRAQFFWWNVLPCKFRESSRLVLPRLGYHGWLSYLTLCGCLSSLSTEKQQFSRDGLSGVSLQLVVVGLYQMQRVLFRHKFIAFLPQHSIYHRHRVALQHFQLHKTESRN